MRKRAFLSAVLLAVLAPAVPATPASATVTVGLIPTTCDGHIAPGSAQAAGNGGTVRGFVVFDDSSCGDRITWFQGAGSSWTTTVTTLRCRVRDVAADATGTYLLYLNHEPPPRGAQPPPGPELAVVKRSVAGTLSFPHRLAYAGDLAPLQAGASSVFAAFGAADAPPGRALLGARFGNSPWRVTEPWASVPGSGDAFGVAGLIDHGKGHTTTVIHSGARLYAVSP